MNKARKLAVFGGSFDPIHIGHLKLAKAAVKEMDIDELIFMPNYISPFKLESEAASASDRLSMIELNLKYDDTFSISRFEVDREGPSYTINTLEHFNTIIDEGTELYFVLGFDSVLTIDTWYHGEDILRNFKLITGRRPGTADEAGLSKIEDYAKKYNAEITVLNLDPFEAASSDIRARIRDGRSTDGILLPEVREYIDEHSLYR